MSRFNLLLAGFLAGLFSLGVWFPVTAAPDAPPAAENKDQYVTDLNGRKLRLRRATDPLRRCKNRDAQEKKRRDREKENERLKAEGRKPGLLSNISLGNNPREGQYRAEMERLLGLEISNVQKAVRDVERKHKDLVQLYPQLRSYQEIVMEDVPGAFRDGEYVSSKKMIIMHYNEQGVIDCVILESFTRNVYNPQQWTRKLIRLYYPNIQTMELETHRHHYQLDGSLELTSPEVQLRALRLVFSNLRQALYSMDMLIAAYYDLREKKNEWQINL